MELEVEKDGVVAKMVDAVKSVSVIQYSLKVRQPHLVGNLASLPLNQALSWLAKSGRSGKQVWRLIKSSADLKQNITNTDKWLIIRYYFRCSLTVLKRMTFFILKTCPGSS